MRSPVELIPGFCTDFPQVQPFFVIHLTFTHLWAVHALVPCGCLLAPSYPLSSISAFPFFLFTALPWWICLSFAALLSPVALTSVGYICISQELVFAALCPCGNAFVSNLCEEPCETEGIGICLIVNSNENLLELSILQMWKQILRG